MKTGKLLTDLSIYLDGFNKRFRNTQGYPVALFIILDNDDITDLLDLYGDAKDIDFEEILESLKGDVAVTVEVNGKNVFILFGGALNTKPATLNSFAKSFGASSNPISVPMNEKLVETMIEDAADTYLSKLKNAGSFDF